MPVVPDPTRVIILFDAGKLPVEVFDKIEELLDEIEKYSYVSSEIGDDPRPARV